MRRKKRSTIKNYILFLLAIILGGGGAYFYQDVSFDKSKKLLLKRVYFDHQVTFYCQNPYEIKTKDGKEQTLIIKDKKYYTPRNEKLKSGEINVRATRVEWEHIVPAHALGKNLACWKNGGRKGCANDAKFKKMEADMHNLVPAIGEVNNDRSNFAFGTKLPRGSQYGACKFEVNFKQKIAYPREDIRGDIARTYMYMAQTHGLNLSEDEKKRFKQWDKADPVDEWERTKNRRIAKIQGNFNPFIGEN